LVVLVQIAAEIGGIVGVEGYEQAVGDGLGEGGRAMFSTMPRRALERG
jgi:hypothetical protein